jgi:hypothetical protein
MSGRVGSRLRDPARPVARTGPLAYIDGVGRDFNQTVRDACLWLPEAEEHLSHGSPNFRVRGKTFATYVVNHHGDGRVALWVNLPRGAQEALVEADRKRYFVPPYVGPSGWVGVRLDQGLSWKHVVARVREAYEKVAPPALRAAIGRNPTLAAPARKLTAADIDPMQSPRGRSLLKTLRAIAAQLPAVREVRQFGNPAWQAGRKTFLWSRMIDGRARVYFWVGVAAQTLMTDDQRFSIPAYRGHNGWIGLDVSDDLDRSEVAALTLQSYRHFALKRMLRQLPPDALSSSSPTSRPSRRARI